MYGFGERKTPKPFVSACDIFIYVDALSEPAGELQSGSPVIRRIEPPKRPFDHAALQGLAQAVNSSIGYGNDYAYLANVGGYLSRISHNLNARNYGYERLRDFVEASGIVQVKIKEMGNHPPVVLVRLKEF